MVNKVPIGRYIAFVGSLLLAVLFIANWYLPIAPTQSVTSREAEPIIRIKSDRTWPERIVFDTSAPTIVLQKPPVVADAPVTNPPREALALLTQVRQFQRHRCRLERNARWRNAPHTPGGKLIDRLRERKRYPLVGNSIRDNTRHWRHLFSSVVDLELVDARPSFGANRRKCLLRSHANKLFARTQLLLGVGESCFEHFANRLPRAPVELK